MRVAVYLDYVHSRDGVAVYAPRAFSRFVTGMRPAFERLVIAGRVDPSPGTSHYRLPEDVEFLELPFYASAAGLRQLLRVVVRSLRTWNAALRNVDAVWVLGPQGLAVPLALLALVRRKRVVLGVRQDLRAYAASRHPGRRGVQLAAWMLGTAFQLIGRFTSVVVVGPVLAERYQGSRALLVLTVSMISEDQLARFEDVERPWDGDILRLLSVGRLEQEKNPLLLADILANVRRDDPRWRLVVCGEGPLEQALRDRLEELGVADAAEFKGYLSVDGALLDVYRQAHAFLHVSWTEGLPQVLFEAYAARLPVVATAVGSVASFTVDAALLADPGDAATPAEHLARISRDPSLRVAMTAAGLEIVKRYTLETETRRAASFIVG